jgi:pilus assembly protein Flp/PilA
MALRAEERTMKWILRRWAAPEPVISESGVTAIEYGLIAALIAVVIIGALGLVGTNLTGTFTTVSASL